MIPHLPAIEFEGFSTSWKIANKSAIISPIPSVAGLFLFNSLKAVENGFQIFPSDHIPINNMGGYFVQILFLLNVAGLRKVWLTKLTCWAVIRSSWMADATSLTIISNSKIFCIGLQQHQHFPSWLVTCHGGVKTCLQRSAGIFFISLPNIPMRRLLQSICLRSPLAAF